MVAGNKYGKSFNTWKIIDGERFHIFKCVYVGDQPRVKELEAKITELETEIQNSHDRVAALEEQLKTVGVKIEEHKGVVKGREEEAIQKAEKAQELQQEVVETEEANLKASEEVESKSSSWWGMKS